MQIYTHKTGHNPAQKDYRFSDIQKTEYRFFFILLLFIILFSGCAAPLPKSDDERYLSVKSLTRPVPVSQNEGADPPQADKPKAEVYPAEKIPGKTTSEKSASDIPESASPEPENNSEKKEKRNPEPEDRYPSLENKKNLPNERINIRVQNEDLKLLLRVLAKIAGISIIISENVNGKATIVIQNKPWDQVFLGVLRSYGLIYEWEGDIIRVMPVEDMGFDLKKLEMQQKREARKREIETVAPLRTAIIEIDYADTDNLREIFEKFLDDGTGVRRGSVMVNRHTNSLIIQARENDIEAMRLLAEKLDRPTHQIRIEAQIVEANSDTAKELGIEWGGIYSGSVGDNKKLWITPGVDSGADNLIDNNNSSAIPSPGLIQKLPAVIAGDSGLLLGVIAQDVGKYALGVQLSALENEGKLRILSSPSISTLDNHTALIESGREVPYQTVEDNEVNIEFKKAVLSLEVTPHVIEDTTLKMKIITEKDELDFSHSVLGNPTVITKRAETNVILLDGQTMVIGGLRKESASESESGVPFLKNIPLFGQIFRRDYRGNNLEELLIFITPRIVRMPVIKNPE